MTKPGQSARSMYLLHEPKEHVSVDGSLMSLIQHDYRVLLEVGVNETLPQQHAIRHVLDHCLRTCDILKTNCVANLPRKSTNLR